MGRTPSKAYLPARRVLWTDSYRVTVWVQKQYVGATVTRQMQDLTEQQVRACCDYVEDRPDLLQQGSEALQKLLDISRGRAAELMDVALQAAIGRIKDGKGRLQELVQAAQVASRIAGTHEGDNRELEARSKGAEPKGAMGAYLPRVLLDVRVDQPHMEAQTVLGTVVAEHTEPAPLGPRNIIPPSARLLKAKAMIAAADEAMYGPGEDSDDGVVPAVQVAIPVPEGEPLPDDAAAQEYSEDDEPGQDE